MSLWAKSDLETRVVKSVVQIIEYVVPDEDYGLQ